MKDDWFMFIVLAGVAPVGVAFVLLWWRTSGRWAAMKAGKNTPAGADKPQVVVKNDPPRE